MEYAPILIPTLCRYDHFVRCIESLKKNTWAIYTDVYVALDYPAKESHWDGYNKICKYLENSFDEFANFYVVKRPYNYGAAKNMADLRKEILEKYDCFIRTDDDCEFSTNFLEYMDKSLEKYKDDENILGVTGYSYPVSWKIDPKYNAFKNSLIFSMWGTGFWKNKFLKMQQDIESGYIKKHFSLNNLKTCKMTDACYLDCLNGKFSYDNNNLIMFVTDIACGCYMQLIGKYIITPTISKVRNYGFDGSGIFCQKIEDNAKVDNAKFYNYRLQEIDTLERFDLSVEENYNFEENYKLLNEFNSRKKNEILKAKVKYCIKWIIIKICHERFYKKMLGKIKKND